MISISSKLKCASLLVIGAFLTVNTAIADKPEWAGKGKGGKHERSEKRDDQRAERHDDRNGAREGRGASGAQRGHFEDRHAVLVRDYYGEQMRGGRCPPGLAKKNNGCMPPGQAKKWDYGHRLPPDVIYYAVPQPLVVQIGTPPSGYRYVRVANDILMIVIGSGMVVDAITNLGRS